MKTSWNDERVAVLRAMWEEGESASMIAKRINRDAGQALFTRNAVIGKAHREGLPGHVNALEAPSRAPRTALGHMRLLNPQDAA